MKKWQQYFLVSFIIVSLIGSLLMLYLFIGYQRKVDVNYPIATDAVEQYGDFIGGVIGTILSCILLYFTFALQREDSVLNSKVYVNQQINDEFFHLIAVYNEVLNNFEVEGDDDRFYIGKLALHKSVENMDDGYSCDTPSTLGRKKAVSAYLDFYARERNFAPVYFRTIYRICQIVDNSVCDESKKVEYMKILRAQFTDSELILLRYNAMTALGKKFAIYINKYNLLKHIPIFMLLEYKTWRKKLRNMNDSYKVSNLLQVFRQKMADLLAPYETSRCYKQTSGKKKYNIHIRCGKKKDLILIAFQRNKAITLPDGDDFKALDILSLDELTNLLRYYMKDCFVLNSFNQLNPRKELEMDYKIRKIKINQNTDIKVIITWVKHLNGNPLNFSSFNNQKR